MAALRVAQHALVPAVVDGLPHGPQVLRHGRTQRADGAGKEAWLRCQALECANAARRDGGGRVDANPAHAFLPDFGPGVGVALAQHPVVVDAIEFTALVAGDDARRHVERAHQHDEG